MKANTKVLNQTLASMNEKENIEKFLIYNLSIVIAGSKPSATINLKKKNSGKYKSWLRYGGDFIKGIDLDYIILREDDDAIILLIYSEELLKKSIFSDVNYSFLTGLGYCGEKSTKMYLSKLKERYEIYNCPHELGVFLGFPINDVRDFMECTSKKCLMCGYWKVYNDLDNAIKVFDKFNFIKKQAAENILYGLESHDLVYKLQAIN